MTATPTTPASTGRRARSARPVAVAAVFVVLLLALAAVVVGGPVGAQDTGSLVLRQVDTSEPADSRLQFVYTGPASEVEDARLVGNGDQISSAPPRALPGSTPIATALVFDTSTAMDESGALVAAKDAAKEWVEDRSGAAAANQVFAVYAASDTGIQIQGFTSDTERLVAAIDRVAPAAATEDQGLSAMWSAVGQAASALDARNAEQPNLVVMTGTTDNATPSAERPAARGDVTSSGATVFAAEYLNAGLDPAAVDSLVATNGGLVLRSDSGPDFGELVEEIATAITEQQYEMVYDAGVDPGTVVDLTLEVGGQSATASVVTGSSVQGEVALNPEIIESSGGVSALQGNLGLIALVLVGLLAAGLFAFAIFSLFVREDRLAQVLQPYDDAMTTSALGDGADDDADTSLARTAIVQRAVQITEQVATDRGLLVKVENALERANLPLRAGEGLFFYAAGVVLLTILAFVVGGSLILGLIVGLFAAIVPPAVVNFLAARRRKQFMALLPDTLSLLSGTLRAGYSLMQGVEAVSQEVAEPMGTELRRVVTEARLGRPLEEALDYTAVRMASPDFAWAVMAIRIQREVGGNLSELLMTVADTMVQRERLRRDVSALTAEGRVSAFVLGALPIGLGAVMFVLNPDYTNKLITEGLGNLMLAVGVVSMLIGFAWMKKIIDIEI
ncbi:type II secretion system F family protein [Rhabdothermincola salaria]|uniref:type II secretion system F family protein n=1 Tax=Rhabdothermincola salaria TaxID=2903142 RepID=UPI001E5D65C4|nr:type II secretion system F family protein [Rhabdothermincola salaria]MCD9622570.1 type II secretion system F family protein [Rhabdothermincola salaria]